MTACPIRYQRQVPDRKGKIFYISITSLSHISKAPWIIVFNGLALFLVVTVFQLFGDRLSEFVHKKEARTEN